jgi:DNA polymerase I
VSLPALDVYDAADFASRAVSLDLETHLIQPGLLAPPIVCGSRARMRGYLVDAELLSKADAIESFRDALSGNNVIVGANIAFDFGALLVADPFALRDIIRAYDEGRVFDVLIAQSLDYIAQGYIKEGVIYDPRTGSQIRHPGTGKNAKRLSLEIVTDLVLGRVDAKKNDFWRERYALLEHVPVTDWPEEARQYPVDDAINTLEVALAQVGAIPRVDNAGMPAVIRPAENLQGMTIQARAAFALHLASMRGLRTDGELVARFQREADAKHAQALSTFVETGLLDQAGGKQTGKLKKRIATAYGASGTCRECAGTGKVPSKAKSNQRKCVCAGFGCSWCDNRGWVLGNTKINCKTCDASGLDLTTAPSLPRSDGGGISTSRDTLKESGDDLLDEFGDVSLNEKWRTTYLPYLAQATKIPLNPKANILLSSGRTSYDGLIQLMPRDGGLRECFIPRPGHVFCSIDYSGLELATLGQVCLWFVGESEIAERINDGSDLHAFLASQMIGESYEHVSKNKKLKPYAGYRQAAKFGNFGFGGGMGEVKFVLSGRQASGQTTTGPDGRVYKGVRYCLLLGRDTACGREKLTEWKGQECPPVCKACVECAGEIRRGFMSYRGIREYFRFVSEQTEYSGQIEIPWPGPDPHVAMTVGGRTFTSGANGYFQGLAAIGAKHALWNVTRECFFDRESPMYGARPVIFVHDEIFAELPEETAHEAAHRMAEVMVSSMRGWVPDVKISAEPALMRCWLKAAEPLYHHGRLVPWTPEHNAKTCPDCLSSSSSTPSAPSAPKAA